MRFLEKKYCNDLLNVNYKTTYLAPNFGDITLKGH